MIFKTTKPALLLLAALLLTACAAPTMQMPVQVQIPPPSAELMTPAPPSPVNVDQLLNKWTTTLEAWLAKLQACKDTPAKCA